MSDSKIKGGGSHILFDNLLGHIPSILGKSMYLIETRNGVLYIWNDSKTSLDTADIKAVLGDSEFRGFTSIKPSSSLYFEVEKVLVNSSSTIVAVSGQGGIATMKLPEKQFLVDKVIEVPCLFIASSLFMCNHCTIRQIKWHPGSPTDSHLLLLTSDDCMRLCNALDETIIWKCCLLRRSISRNVLSAVDSPVDFDISSPEGLCWPVYVVWANGDVYILKTSFVRDFSTAKLLGPLCMLPQCDDNYGADATSIIVLQSSPPLIVLSTSSGVLYHFVALPFEFEDDIFNLNNEDDPCVKALYVTEKIELDLGLILDGENDYDLVTCPIHLISDPGEAARYFCIHKAGIHSVVVPLVSKLNKVGHGPLVEVDFFDCPSLPDYILCTAISMGLELSTIPMSGVALANFADLLVLLSNGKLLKLPLLGGNLNSEEKYDCLSSPDENLFQNVVGNALSEKGLSKCSEMMIKLPVDNNRPQDWLEIVLQTTEQYRPVLKTHSDVALQIKQKSDILKLTVQNQKSSLQFLIELKNHLIATNKSISEKFRKVKENQSDLTKRTEKLMVHIECLNDKSLSVKETEMLLFLEKVKDKLFQLKKDSASLQICVKNFNESTTEDLSSSNTQLGCKAQNIYSHLKLLNENISDLCKRLKHSQETLSEYLLP